MQASDRCANIPGHAPAPGLCAGAARQSAQVLLLDEPTNGLDPQAIRDFYATLRELQAGGVTIVITSHILAELQSVWTGWPSWPQASCRPWAACRHCVNRPRCR